MKCSLLEQTWRRPALMRRLIGGMPNERSSITRSRTPVRKEPDSPHRSALSKICQKPAVKSSVRRFR
jgi:hypothetical protein